MASIAGALCKALIRLTLGSVVLLAVFFLPLFYSAMSGSGGAVSILFFTTWHLILTWALLHDMKVSKAWPIIAFLFWIMVGGLEAMIGEQGLRNDMLTAWLTATPVFGFCIYVSYSVKKFKNKNQAQ